jgi:Glycosyltransferase family 9 (heptosyltransferase)
MEKMMNFIPLFCAGGIGDLIVSLDWIEYIIKPLNIPVKLYTNFPEISAYFLPWIGEIKDFHTGERDKIDFDYFISISDMIFFEVRAEKELPIYIKDIYSVIVPHKKEWEEYLKVHPMKGNEMAHKAISLGQKRWTLPFYFVDKPYQQFILNNVKQINIPEKFITIHDGFDASGYYKFMRSMKSWDVDYWASFIMMFKVKYPEISIVQLGGVKHQKIKGVDVNLAGQLSFEKSLEYLNSSLVHIDGDSGLVHARRLLKKPSIVLFGPTNVDYFGYPENINLSANFCGDCWWKKRDWMQNCVKEYSKPKCMDSITPDIVMKAVDDLFSTIKISGASLTPR